MCIILKIFNNIIILLIFYTIFFKIFEYELLEFLTKEFDLLKF